MSTEQSTAADGGACALTRILYAPVEQVWRAWTTPERYARWAGAAAGSVDMDVRPSGAWKATMLTRDGGQFPADRLLPRGYREPAPGDRHGRTRQA
ncbi:SRPBCC domain-containing protein [Streptomyces sp. NPDC007903]|uniref:SRPBCC domain-containing protein n=1 Tax=Streptomyces sp. NPDC007903 TaxID=3364786 RepID=UPI0036E887B0